jgi:AmmeMemoRadiSam system protein A
LTSGSPSGSDSGILTDEERAKLLAIARRSVERYLKNGIMFAEVPDSDSLNAPGAAFVTLTHRGSLRGCIGYTEAVAPLYRTVQECAVAAATEDPRFPPVTLFEIQEIVFSISVLAPSRPIRPEEVRVGTHGLVVTHEGRRGLLLPQVAVEHGWDAETFLSQACIKAGLPPDAWRLGATIEAFTAEVITE